ncbi:MAG: protein translocase SEC61 complex subunit gamma [Candidatus Aenigmarchaeota archaeon]|nr:protein translocase SEC61 complex subunit gamma [Candidatus Aenigmarchaeota archaeon]
MKIDIKSKLLEWKRILQIARKPDRDEFFLSSKICTLGIVVIGIIGFLMYLAFAFLGL